VEHGAREQRKTGAPTLDLPEPRGGFAPLPFRDWGGHVRRPVPSGVMADACSTWNTRPPHRSGPPFARWGAFHVEQGGEVRPRWEGLASGWRGEAPPPLPHPERGRCTWGGVFHVEQHAARFARYAPAGPPLRPRCSRRTTGCEVRPRFTAGSERVPRGTRFLEGAVSAPRSGACQPRGLFPWPGCPSGGASTRGLLMKPGRTVVTLVLLAGCATHRGTGGSGPSPAPGAQPATKKELPWLNVAGA